MRTSHLLLSLLFVVACDPRIEEPVPPGAGKGPAGPSATAQAPSSAPAASVASPASASASGAPSEARCIEPTPAEPERKVTLQGKFDPKCPPDPETPPKLRTGKVTFDAVADRPVTVEIAERGEARMRGLMYRKSMGDDAGMIFVFQGHKEEHTFWMKNTCIPLDMLFIDDDGTIVGIEENTPTLTEETFSVGCKSRYVLELNAGWTRKHGVKAGQKVKLDGIPG
ncbi:MAG: DUF192 domain-containing protein [Polyangiaceae bacterium]